VPGNAWHGSEYLAPEQRESAARDGYALGAVELVDDAARVPVIVPVAGQA
jgi:hypothetical protein